MAKKKVHAARRTSDKSSSKKARRKSGGRVRAKGAAKGAASAQGAAAGAKELKSAAIANLKWVHATLEKMIEGFPSDRATYQVSPSDNHLMWTVGHLATSYSWFASLVDGRALDLPESYQKLFGYQSKPVSDPGVYPPLDEVKRTCLAAYARMIQALEALKPADAGKATATESHGFASSRLDVAMKAAWHDGWHSGQLSTIRRALGLPGVF